MSKGTLALRGPSVRIKEAILFKIFGWVYVDH
mgnify:FL=1